MVGEDADVAEAEVDQDLGADAGFVLNEALAGGFAVKLAARVNVNLRELSGFVGLVGAEAAAGVEEIEEDAAVFFSAGFERALDGVFAITVSSAEVEAWQTVRMNAEERGR